MVEETGIYYMPPMRKDWRITRIGYVCRKLAKPILEDSIALICSNKGKVQERPLDVSGKMVSEDHAMQGISKGDIAIHGMDTWHGAIAHSKLDGKITRVVHVCDSSEDNRYIVYYLQILANLGVYKLISNGVRENTSDFRSWDKVKDIRISLPPIKVQNAICDYLDDKCGQIDKAIIDARDLIEKYKLYRESVIIESVTKGLDKEVPLKETNIEWIGNMPEHWGMVRLRFLCMIQTGDQDTQDSDEEGSYRFYVRSPIVEHSNRYTFDGEGILMAGDGAGAGRIFHHAYGRYAVHQRVYRLSGFKNIDSNYLYYFLSSLFCKEMDRGSAQTTVPSVRLPMLMNFNVCIPSLPEQQLIAKYLDEKCDQIDTIIAQKEQMICQLQDYKKSMVFEYVTGKKEVPNG